MYPEDSRLLLYNLRVVFFALSHRTFAPKVRSIRKICVRLSESVTFYRLLSSNIHEQSSCCRLDRVQIHFVDKMDVDVEKVIKQTQCNLFTTKIS